jgi:hypothetical protein
MPPRNNEDRVGAAGSDTAAPTPDLINEKSPLTFTTPTEFVELPTRGRFYPEDHLLHNVEEIEIRFMTAKDEDILSSKTLLKKGVAIDRLLQNVIVDKRINVGDLLVGDKNALIVASRITGYGPEYETRVTCPACSKTSDFSFNLEESTCNYGEDFGDFDIRRTDSQTCVIKMPTTGVDIEVRLLTGADEKKLLTIMEKRKKHKLPESFMTEQFKLFTVSVNGHTELVTITSFVENMPATDARYLRGAYQKIVPNVDLTQEFACEACSYEMEMEVPFTADFFWPRR